MTAKILLQLDTDAMPSTFDSVVAIDSGVDQLLRQGGVTVDNVAPLVHGAMFTRGGETLKNTAIFVGGGHVPTAEAVAKRIVKEFFGPVRVSVLLDANGCNTTAAAAVLSLGKHLDLSTSRVAVLAGTGPVGRRVAEMVLLEGGQVNLVSRSGERGQATVHEILAKLPAGIQKNADLVATQAANATENAQAVQECHAVVACGAAGVELLSSEVIAQVRSMKVAIDLNAVPPQGIAGIAVTDKAKAYGELIGYGALGVGGLKMKIHRAAIQRLFESNDQVLDAAEVLAIGKEISRKFAELND